MKKNLLLALACTLLVAASVNAQLNYDHAFSLGLNVNDMGYSIAADASGNYYCTGFHTYWMDANPLGTPYYIYNNGGTTADIYVAKYNSSGIMSWAFDIGGSGDDAALKIIVDAGNNVYIAGRFQDTVDFDPGSGIAKRISNGGTDIFLAKYNSDGIYQWADAIGDSLDEQAWDIAIDPVSGNAIITGGYSSFSMDMDPGNGTHIINNNGYAAFNTGNCFVASYGQSTGAYQWAFNIGGFGGATGNKVVTDNAGNIYVGGTVSGDSTDFDPGSGTHMIYCTSGTYKVFLAKYSGSNALQWVNGFGGPWGQTANSLAVDNSGSIYQGGYFNSDSMDIDPGPGTYFIHNYPNGVQDIYVGKFNSSNGHLNWAFDVGGYYSEVAEDLVLDNSGHFFITGAYGDTVDFDPGTAVHNLYAPLTGSGAYLAEYDTSGHYTDAISFAGNGSQFGIGVCMIAPNKVGVTGFYSADSIDFDPGSAVHNLYVNGGITTWTDAFVATYFTDGSSGIDQITQQDGINVYPNPARDVITISFSSNSAVDEINIVNVLGETVYQSETKLNAGTYRKQIDCSNLPAGIYFIKLKSGNEIRTGKFIRE